MLNRNIEIMSQLLNEVQAAGLLTEKNRVLLIKNAVFAADISRALICLKQARRLMVPKDKLILNSFSEILDVFLRLPTGLRSETKPAS